jgi:molybdopterin adenylyltransferase
VRTAILTVSTTVAAGEGDDRGGLVLARLAEAAGAEVVARDVVTDDADAIAGLLRGYVADDLRFVFTTGGTGLTADDVTPEATRAVLDRDAPGYAEAMRAASLVHTPMGVLSRGVSGIAGRTLIINFPGNPPAIEQLFPIVAPTLAHAAQTLSRTGGRAAGD